jgi:transposase
MYTVSYHKPPGRNIIKFCADAGYRGTSVLDIDKIFGLSVDISEKTKPHEWEKLSWRWIVESTFSWLNNYRHLNKDYDISSASAELSGNKLPATLL